MKLLRRKLREVYPYGLRENYPYKTWCDEIKRQLNLAPYDKNKAQVYQEKLQQQGQRSLFPEGEAASSANKRLHGDPHRAA